MWLFTPFGFYSVVQKAPGEPLTVRARVAADLDALRERYMPSLSLTIAHAGTDYPYRATISHEDFAAGLAAIARDIDYSNFKSEVHRQQGPGRARIYGQLWLDLRGLEPERNP